MLHQVGAGPLGPVFRAHDPAEGRLVAIKAFRLDLPPSRLAEFAAALDALSTRSLDHPSIATPIAAGVEGTTPWLASTYVPAESLDSALRQYGPPPLADALSILTELAGALDFAAAAGVLHGALHPRDVLVAPDDTRLIDLGVAPALELVGLRAPVRRPYVAPERLDAGPASRAGDVFSLGAIAFELLTGRRVAGAGDDAVADLPDIPGAERDALVDTFAFVLSAAPDERFTTALGFVAALKRALGDAPARRPAAVPPPSADSLEHALEREALARAARETAAAPVVPGALAGPEVDAAPTDARPTEVVPAATAPLPVKEPVSVTKPPRPRAPRPRPAAREPIPTRADAPGDLDSTESAATPVPEPLIAATPALPLDEVEMRPGASAHAPRWNAHDEAPLSTAGTVRPAYDEPSVARASTGGRGWYLSAPILAGLVVVAMVVGLVLGWMLFSRSGPSSSGAPVVTESREPSPPPPHETPAAAPATEARRAEPPEPVDEEPGTSAGITGPGESPDRPAAEPPPPQPAGAARAAPRVDTAPEKTTAARKTPPPAPERRGQLVVRSTPAGARVEVNGRVRGATPLALRDLPLGAVTVRVIRNGYTTEQRRVTLTRGRSSQVLEVPLRSAPAAAGRPAGAFVGTIFVETRPTGAQVFIDNKPVGTSPLSVPGIAAGSHVVRLELAGHRRWTASVQVVAGERNRVAASLEEEEVR